MHHSIHLYEIHLHGGGTGGTGRAEKMGGLVKKFARPCVKDYDPCVGMKSAPVSVSFIYYTL